MRKMLTCFILSAFCLNISGNETDKLFPIKEKDLYGYMNNKGEVIIRPKYHSVTVFSEGLAAVRHYGTYGYIDKAGTIAIQPLYDIAQPFKNGIAKVFIGSKPYFIDKTGKILFDHSFSNISDFNKSSLAIVTTLSGKQGAVNKAGTLIIDTVFQKINPFSNDIAVVFGLKHNPYYSEKNEKIHCQTGVIDTLGNWVVPYGVYNEIEDFINGYAQVKKGGSGHINGVIDSTGNYRFTTPVKEWYWDYNDQNFHQGIAIVRAYKKSGQNKKEYIGAVSPDGELIFSNDQWEYISPYSYNRAFAKDKNSNWHLINTKGKIITPQVYHQTLRNRYRNERNYQFIDGKAFVETDKGWGFIDTSGQYVVNPVLLNEFEYYQFYREGDFILIVKDISIENENYSYSYGFWNTKNNIIVKPQYHFIGINRFENELICVMQDEKYSYINESGQKVWSETKDSSQVGQLNIDFMNRGYFYASSRYRADLAGYGGWGKSENSSDSLPDGNQFSDNSLQIFIDTNQKTLWAEKYDAYKLFLANTTKDTLYFDAQDSRLYLTIEALDKDGNWKDIEYLPSSWCGNSYHTMYLAPTEFWSFATPVYYGEFKTKLRAKLYYQKSRDQKESDILYSNEIDGYVNPGQFWNKKEYQSNGLMDPYND